MTKPRSVCVIGAGPCGLATGKVLKQAGFDVEILDASPGIGGLWNMETPHTAAYQSLRANTSKRAMAYSDFPMPASFPDFPDRGQVLEYLNAYVDHFGLRGDITLNAGVERASRSAGRWTLWLDGGIEHPRRYDALVACTGQFRFPVLPTLPGADTFEGMVLHARDYLGPSAPHALGGRSVVVLGLGTSALDIAGELSEAGSQVALSVRSGRFLAPKMLGDKPLDGKGIHPSQPLPQIARLLPRWLAVWGSRRAIRGFYRNVQDYYGTATALGFPEPAYQPWEKPPTITADIRPMLAKGRISIKPAIARLQGREVLFADGSRVEADAVICGTGYRWAFPFLKQALADAGDDADKGEELVLDHRIAHPRVENLFFVGFCKQLCSILPLAEQQAQWLAVRLADADTRATGPTRLSQPFGTICNFYVDDLRRDMRRRSSHQAPGATPAVLERAS